MSDKEIYDYVERLSNLLRNELRSEGADSGLQPVQLEALRYLSVCNRYSDTPMGVTDYLGQTKGTVSQSLKVLETKGFISKQADKQDKRVSHLKVTAKGKKLLLELFPPEKFSKACEQLGSQVSAEIVASLKTLLGAMQKANQLKPFGMCGNCRHNEKVGKGAYFCHLTQESLSQRDIALICREFEDKS